MNSNFLWTKCIRAAFEIVISMLRVAYGAVNNSLRWKWDMSMRKFTFSEELKMVAKKKPKTLVALFGVKEV